MQHVLDFENDLRTKPLPGRRRRVAAERTIKGYVSDVSRFAFWLQEQTGKPFAPNLITRDDVQDYIIRLKRDGHKPASILRQAAAISAFCRWAVHKGLVANDESVGIALPTEQKLAPKGLDRLQRRALRRALNIVPKTENAKVRLLRDTAMVMVMMYAGLRVSEIAGLELKHLMLNGRSGEVLIVGGKGDKDRRSSLPKESLDPLKKWIDTRPACDHDFVFIELRHSPGGGYPALGTRSVQNIVKNLGKQAGIANLTPHVLRHTAVHIWRERGVDPFVIAAQMGHEDINTTMRYGKPTADDLRKAAQQVSGEDDDGKRFNSSRAKRA